MIDLRSGPDVFGTRGLFTLHDLHLISCGFNTLFSVLLSYYTHYTPQIRSLFQANDSKSSPSFLHRFSCCWYSRILRLTDNGRQASLQLFIVHDTPQAKEVVVHLADSVRLGTQNHTSRTVTSAQAHYIEPPLTHALQMSSRQLFSHRANLTSASALLTS